MLFSETSEVDGVIQYKVRFTASANQQEIDITKYDSWLKTGKHSKFFFMYNDRFVDSDPTTTQKYIANLWDFLKENNLLHVRLSKTPPKEIAVPELFIEEVFLVAGFKCTAFDRNSNGSKRVVEYFFAR